MAEYKRMITGELEVNCYLVYSLSSGKCFIVDPGDNGDEISAEIKKNGLDPEAVILTHGHMDHCGGVSFLVSAFGIPLVMHREDLPVLDSEVNRGIASALGLKIPEKPDRFFADGDILGGGDLELKVIHTPGHTSGSVCFRTGDLLFTGDTLFAGSIGRTDLPGGDFKTLQKSLDRIREFPEETVILPGHGDMTVLKRELDHNPFM